jgi:hypothetical protein
LVVRTSIEHVPHLAGRVHVLDFQVARIRIHHNLGGWRDAAIIQVDHIPINRKGVAYIQPKIFVSGDSARPDSFQLPCICKLAETG